MQRSVLDRKVNRKVPKNYKLDGFLLFSMPYTRIYKLNFMQMYLSIFFKSYTVIPCTGMQHKKNPSNLEYGHALNTLFGHFWTTVLMPHLKPETLV